MFDTKKVFGFTLIEVTIVLALSLVLLGMASGMYSLRRNIASDDAVKQIAVSIQAVRTEAQKGLGPTGSETSLIGAGDSLYGQSIGLKNTGCNNPARSCLNVRKIAQRPAPASTLYSYGSYQIELPESMAFDLIATGTSTDCTTYLSCYKMPAGSNQPLSASPIFSSTSGDPVEIVVLNRTGAMYVFRGNPDTDIFVLNQYTASRTGVLNMVLAGFTDRTSINDSTAWNSAGPKYFMNIDLSGTNTITTERK